MRKLSLLLALPALLLAIWDMQWYDPNHWSAPFYNDGRWGLDVTVGSGVAGGSWPRPLRNFYVFGAGLWVGGIVDGDTLVSVGYNPNTGGTEMCPTLCRYWRGGYSNMLDRIYRYPGDWPPSHSRFPMAPLWELSDMDMWTGCSDSDPAMHDSFNRPLGVDVYVTVDAYGDSLGSDFFFLRYELANRSGRTLDSLYVGPVLDADVGTASDDLTGLILDHLFHVGPDTIRVRNTGFAYDYNNVENPGQTWESGTPGAVAVMLLEAQGGLGLASFKRLELGGDPVTDPQRYLVMAGYDFVTREYAPYDSLDLMPGDKRFVMCSGPFSLLPDSVATFWYAVIGSPFGEQGQPPEDRDTSELALRCKWARDYFERLTGVTEETPSAEVRAPNCGPTVIRNVLFLPVSLFTLHSSLFDMTGRKVQELKSGANDLLQQAPGAYFVRSAVGGQRSTWKVVIQR